MIAVVGWVDDPYHNPYRSICCLEFLRIAYKRGCEGAYAYERSLDRRVREKSALDSNSKVIAIIL